VSKSSPITRHEVLSVLILSLGFGLVGIDRFLISTMYPTISRDLHLGYGDIGTITGVLAIAWGVAALIMGNLSDRIGQRCVLVVSLVAFSLLIGASGLAAGLSGLVLVRVVMGFADGAYTPASIVPLLSNCRHPSVMAAMSASSRPCSYCSAWGFPLSWWALCCTEGSTGAISFRCF
jgi:predicted MFS family arabinose efflux permease